MHSLRPYQIDCLSRSLECLTRTTIQLERLNMEFRTATFVDAIDSAIPAVAEMGNAFETATDSWRNLRG